MRFGRHKTPPKRNTKEGGKRAQQTNVKPASVSTAKPAAKASPAKQEGRPIKTTSGVKKAGSRKAVSTSEMAKKLNGGKRDGNNKG